MACYVRAPLEMLLTPRKSLNLWTLSTQMPHYGCLLMSHAFLHALRNRMCLCKLSFFLPPSTLSNLKPSLCQV
jgi:hypothetical protein